MMRKVLINWNMIFVFLCVALLLTAGCTKKKIDISPTAADSAAVGGSGSIEDLGDGARDADAVRQKRLHDMEFGEGGASHGDATIYFDYDSAELSSDAQRTLKQVASELQSNPSQSVDISGHCDERGTIEYNLALGEKRARAAKKFLVALGISGDRIACISYGEERPIDPRSTEDAWAQNRRDEFVYIK
jgi:peptidoglycan-associated lipoprotein